MGAVCYEIARTDCDDSGVGGVRWVVLSSHEVICVSGKVWGGHPVAAVRGLGPAREVYLCLYDVNKYIKLLIGMTITRKC